MSIGPFLPPHLQNLRRGEDTDSEEDEEEVGPRLPEVACRAPKPPSPGRIPDEEDESSDDEFGPAIPAHLANRLNPAPTTGAAQSDHTEDDESDDDDDDGIGPRPPQPGDTNSILRSQMSDIERRAQSMKDKIEGKDKEVVQRDTWMLELPSAKAKSFGLGARTFSRKGITQVGDRSAWTDTPENREKRARGEIDEVEDPDNEVLVNRARDEVMGKVTEELRLKRGTDSLLDIHGTKLKKKDKKDKDEGQGRRPFDRDVDLGANQFDEAQRKLMIKKAAQITDRFSSGVQKFL